MKWQYRQHSLTKLNVLTFPWHTLKFWQNNFCLKISLHDTSSLAKRTRGEDCAIFWWSVRKHFKVGHFEYITGGKQLWGITCALFSRNCGWIFVLLSSLWAFWFGKKKIWLYFFLLTQFPTSYFGTLRHNFDGFNANQSIVEWMKKVELIFAIY